MNYYSTMAMEDDRLGGSSPFSLRARAMQLAAAKRSAVKAVAKVEKAAIKEVKAKSMGKPVAAPRKAVAVAKRAAVKAVAKVGKAAAKPVKVAKKPKAKKAAAKPKAKKAAAKPKAKKAPRKAKKAATAAPKKKARKMRQIGTNAMVFRGTAHKTAAGRVKADLMRNAKGRIVTRAGHMRAINADFTQRYNHKQHQKRRGGDDVAEAAPADYPAYQYAGVPRYGGAYDPTYAPSYGPAYPEFPQYYY
jgi:hypothetical protein